LLRLDELVASRRRIAELYREYLADIPEIALPVEPSWARSNWQSFCVMLPDHVDQRDVMQLLLDRGISTRRGVMNAHREPAYAAPGNARIGSFLNCSEYAQDHAIMLPMSAQMDEDDVARVAEALSGAMATARFTEPA
jgi:dTDP-4-amino-4,6-dideoxygalactose transaminase